MKMKAQKEDEESRRGREEMNERKEVVEDDIF
jgi:hypothetical protein